MSRLGRVLITAVMLAFIALWVTHNIVSGYALLVFACWFAWFTVRVAWRK